MAEGRAGRGVSDGVPLGLRLKGVVRASHCNTHDEVLVSLCGLLLLLPVLFVRFLPSFFSFIYFFFLHIELYKLAFSYCSNVIAENFIVNGR